MISNFNISNKIVNKCFLKSGIKSFSVFNKLKDYLKSGMQSTYSVFGTQIDPDKLKIEYEEEETQTKKSPKGRKGLTLKEIQRTPETKIVEQLPNEMISKQKL